jgi:hypothetical protein
MTRHEQQKANLVFCGGDDRNNNRVHSGLDRTRRRCWRNGARCAAGPRIEVLYFNNRGQARPLSDEEQK